MSKTVTIQNAQLSVSASAQGAELQSIRSGETEYLWQGDPAYWADRAPNLFPYVGRLTGGCYLLDGKTYHMSIHGIALYLPFTLVEHSQTSMTFQLLSDDSTRQQYPRDFSFRVRYYLEQATLHIEYEVENQTAVPMHFGLGGHPGFRIPLEDGKVFEDYRLRFSENCTPTRIGFSDACFLDGTDKPYPLEENCCLPLRHDMFDEDAIVLRNIPHEVTLEATGGSRSVTVSFPDMPYLGLWHMPKTDAPYVCIEPWCSLPSWQDRIAVFEEQPDLLRLESHGKYRNTWCIRISETGK